MSLLLVGLLVMMVGVMESTSQELVPIIPSSSRARYYAAGRIWNNNRFIQREDSPAPQQLVRLDQAHLLTRPEPEMAYEENDPMTVDWAREGESNGRHTGGSPSASNSEQRFFMDLFTLPGFLRTPVLTVYSFVPTAITSTSTRYCIKSLHYGGITACGRKRRAAQEPFLLDSGLIEPSPSYQVLTSVAPPASINDQSYRLADYLPSEAAVSSSMMELVNQNQLYQQRRPRFRAYYVSTTTIRIPTVTIRYTTTQRTIQLVADVNSAQLTCLPMGLSIC